MRARTQAEKDELEAFGRSIGLPPYRRWYEFGWRSPKVLFKRLRMRHRPVFRLKMAWQRATRGYGDEDIWSLNHALAKLTVAGCRGIREAGHGYPAELGPHANVFRAVEMPDGEKSDGMKEWESILLRIEEGFQAWLDEDGWFHDKPEQEAKFNDAMALYAKWFSALWD